MELELAAGGLGRHSLFLLSVFLVGCSTPAAPAAPMHGVYGHSRALALEGTAPSFRGGTATIPSVGPELLGSLLPSALGMKEGRADPMGLDKQVFPNSQAGAHHPQHDGHVQGVLSLLPPHLSPAAPSPRPLETSLTGNLLEPAWRAGRSPGWLFQSRSLPVEAVWFTSS